MIFSKIKKFRFNFQMTDLQASIGRVQLSRLPIFGLKNVKRKIKIYKKASLNLLENNSCYIIFLCNEFLNAKIKPKLIILSKSGIKDIIPIEEYELLDSSIKNHVAQKLCQTTLAHCLLT